MTVEDDGDLKAALPLYLKAHSHGEFVFDYGWADIARQLEIPYYPKLVGTAPATPSGFYNLMTSNEIERRELLGIALDRLREFGGSQGIGGLSFLFCDPAFSEGLEGFSPWVNQSFLWINRGYGSFEEYLAEFSKNQRRNVRREWASLGEQGLEIRPLAGAELTRGVMRAMYRFYLRTNDKFGPWAAKFLNEEFFLRLPEYAAHRCVIFAAVKPGVPAEEAVGMSMCVYKDQWLYGRYWGGDEEFRNLHFNACYYAPIHWMIERGIRYFDPGAGSPHKLRRGFMPHEVVSYHRFEDPTLRGYFDSSMGEINRETRSIIRVMEEDVPYRREVKEALRAEIRDLFPA
jgi:predicted N-acyltransferase